MSSTASQVQAWNKVLSASPFIVQASAAAALSPVALFACAVAALIGVTLVSLNLWNGFVL